VPIIKPAQKRKYNTKTAQINKTNTKQTNKQKRTVLQDNIYKRAAAKCLYSQETQVSLFKNAPVQRQICFK
jgi:hypothetical protein